MAGLFFIGLALTITAAVYFKMAHRQRDRATIRRRLGLEPKTIWRGIGGGGRGNG